MVSWAKRCIWKIDLSVLNQRQGNYYANIVALFLLLNKRCFVCSLVCLFVFCFCCCFCMRQNECPALLRLHQMKKDKRKEKTVTWLAKNKTKWHNKSYWNCAGGWFQVEWWLMHIMELIEEQTKCDLVSYFKRTCAGKKEQYWRVYNYRAIIQLIISTSYWQLIPLQ